MIHAIEAVGRQVGVLWRKKGYAKEIFPEIAFTVLKESTLHEQFNREEFLRALWTRERLPKQLSLDNDFGQPPITLYSEGDFLIDIYFWLSPRTAIHSHGFRGAFTILQGKSLHCLYDFNRKETFQEECFIGDLCLREAVLLQKGDVQKILPGPTFIHQVWHLAFPTVSLAVRTFKEREPQYAYEKPHFAFRKKEPSSPVQRKRLDTLAMFDQTKSPLSEKLLEELLSKTDSFEGIMRLIGYMENTWGSDRTREILERLPRFCRWAPYFLEVARRNITTKVDWLRIQNEKERFLIALLYSCSDRDQILRLVRAYAPEKAAEEFIVEQLRGLIKHKSLDFWLNQTALEVLELMVRGKQEEQMCRELSQRYEVKDTASFHEDIHGFCDQLRAVVLFKPLLHSVSEASRKEKSPPETRDWLNAGMVKWQTR